MKQSQRKQKQEHNMAERMMLNDQYTQETDFMIEKRMRSMERQKQINEQNRYFHNIKNRSRVINKLGEGDHFKENPIEYRLRMDFLNKYEKNRAREKDILEYNNNALKMLKLRQKQHKEKEKYYGDQYNNYVESQAVSHIINRTSQQEKYETK